MIAKLRQAAMPIGVGLAGREVGLGWTHRDVRGRADDLSSLDVPTEQEACVGEAVIPSRVDVHHG